MKSQIEVTYFHRNPSSNHFSLERVFRDVRRALPTSIVARVTIAKYVSQGFFRRLYNALEAPFYQGDINHITGDVHYLTYFLKKNRTILTIADCVTLERLQGWRKKVFFFLWYWLPVKRAKLITVISEATRQELLVYLPHESEKIKVIHCPVSTDFIYVAKPFRTDCPIILQVGTGKNKNLLRVAKALIGISCHLRIIGRLSTKQKATLKKYNLDYSSVSNISDSDMVQEYAQADMVIFASTYEGFGLPILEAQATGRPVITSDLLSMPEVAGRGAVLVDPFDVNSIRLGIQKVIENNELREQLVNAGLSNVVAFRPEAIARTYTTMYQELIECV